MCFESKRTFLDDYPRLKKEWNYQRNNELKLYPGNFSYGSNKKVWWKCEEKGHEWETTISNRTSKNKTNCPYCSNKKICKDGISSLFYQASDRLKKEWNEEKNGSMKLYAPMSNKKVWWKCEEKGHEWESAIYNRKQGKNCPYCSHNLLCENGSNSLEITASDQLKKEWNEEKNGSMKLYFPGSRKKVWWKCVKEGHEWKMSLFNRTGKIIYGCPYCSRQKICEDGSNSLEIIASERLKKEWIEEKNGSMKLYAPNSGKKVWWKCIEKGHEWETRLCSRTNHGKTGCPRCKQSKLELEFQKICEDMNLVFTTQIKYKNAENKRPLPYDGSVKCKNIETRVELQGIQHYESDTHYYKYTKFTSLYEYVNRINTDNKKSYSSLKARHNFLSISYLCQGEISTILSRYLEDLENYDILLRYHITPYIYLQYSENNGIISIETDISCEPTDEMLLIHRIYLYQIESLQNPIEVVEENFTECCGRLYFNDTVHVHKMIENHN